jgi:hypothetical protein
MATKETALEKVAGADERPMKKRLQIEYLLGQYKQSHPDVDPAIEPHLIAEWAIKQGISRPVPQTPEEILRKDIARYLKNDYIDDPQGRHVRKNHAIFIPVVTKDGIVRRSRWYEKDIAPPEHMRLSLQLRRTAAFHDVRQMDLDFQSYNDNNVYGVKLPLMDYNMNPDVQESNLPATYPSAPPDDEEGDDEV